MLTVADLEVNVFEFRQRAFQFSRQLEHGGRTYALFTRTETESESRFRPQLVHLTVVVPFDWVVYDEGSDCLRVAKDGANPPLSLVEPVVEVGAEPTEFSEQGLAWKRTTAPSGTLVYAPAELAPGLFDAKGLASVTGP